jgi:hypothetical protein
MPRFARSTLLLIPVTLVLGLFAPMRPPPRPSLVVVIVVDQLRPDQLERWRSQWTGGFAWLLNHGAVFRNGLQDHAITETAPGHASVLSGRWPARTGIALNELGVGDSSAPLIGGGGPGASPHRFRGTTLVDWMRGADPELKVLSVSGKDRGAILTIGKTRGDVYWRVGGRFTTSRYYADSLPPWVTAWNARGGAAMLAGREWTLLLDPAQYAEADSAPWEHGGESFVFPHRVSPDSTMALRDASYTPWMDSLTLDVALEGSARLGLGRRARPDLLAVALSAVDYVGHRYGPDSREIHDHLLRVDRWLGTFLDSLAVQAGQGRLLVVLTADHGVTPFPEQARAQGRDAGRIRLGTLVGELNRQIQRRAGDSVGLEAGSGIIYGDMERLRAAGISPESLATATLPRVWRLPGVADAWTPATLNGAAPVNVHAARWRRSLPTEFRWLVAAAAKPGWIWSDGDGYTTHGTSNPDDVGVPIIFAGPGVRAGQFPDTVRTVDIAPTLARLLGVKAEGRLDGRPVRRASR